MEGLTHPTDDSKLCRIVVRRDEGQQGERWFAWVTGKPETGSVPR
jgi:hypothetical protein